MWKLFLQLAVALANTNSVDEGTLVVANKMDGTISLIQTKTGETTTHKVGYLPHEVVINAEYVYTSNYGSAHIRSSDLKNKPGNTITVLPLTDPTHSFEIDLGPARCAPHGMALSADGHWLYVTCEGRNEIAVVDTTTRSLSHTLPTNQAGSHLIVLSSNGERAYVSNFWHGTVSVFDLPGRRLIAQIQVGRGCEGIGLSLDDQSLFITRVEDNELLKIDTQSLKIVLRKNLAPKSSPIRVWPSPANPNHVLVNNVGKGTLEVFNREDFSSVAEIKVGQQPIGLTVSNSLYAFAANMRDNSIVKIDLKTNQIVKTFATGSAPDGIAFAATSNKARVLESKTGH